MSADEFLDDCFPDESAPIPHKNIEHCATWEDYRAWLWRIASNPVPAYVPQKILDQVDSQFVRLTTRIVKVEVMRAGLVASKDKIVKRKQNQTWWVAVFPNEAQHIWLREFTGDDEVLMKTAREAREKEEQEDVRTASVSMSSIVEEVFRGIFVGDINIDPTAPRDKSSN